MPELEQEIVMVVGGGGREMALAEHVALSPDVREVILAPGGLSTEDIAARTGKPVQSMDIPGGNVAGVMDIVRKHNVNRVIVGPESWLAKGLGNALLEEKIPSIAPPEDRARLELSKAYTRLMGERWGIPQPKFRIFTDSREAVEFVEHKWPWKEGVVKPDGEAEGKGVAVCDTKQEMIQAIISAKGKFGSAADTLLIEERLYGPEASYIVTADGANFYALPPAMDFKRLRDGNTGPNTGGMGSIVPNPFVTPEIARNIEENFVRPIIFGMNEIEKPYVGFLYIGIILTAEGPKLVEINCRGGDPETQAQLPLVPYDIHEIFKRAADGRLAQLGAPTKRVPKASGVVVLAAKGYPKSPEEGAVIYGLDRRYEGVTIYQAGTQKRGDTIVVARGRVLNVQATGENFEQIDTAIYRAIGPNGVRFSDMQYRSDMIGVKNYE